MGFGHSFPSLPFPSLPFIIFLLYFFLSSLFFFLLFSSPFLFSPSHLAGQLGCSLPKVRVQRGGEVDQVKREDFMFLVTILALITLYSFFFVSGSLLFLCTFSVSTV